MPTFLLYLKAELENISKLEVPEGGRFCIDVKESAGSESRERVYVSSTDEHDLSGSKGKANFVMKFAKDSRHECSINVLQVKGVTRPLTEEDDRKWVPVVALECRGIEPTAFHPEDGFLVTTRGNKKFDEVDLAEGEWNEYDDKINESVLQLKQKPHVGREYDKEKEDRQEHSSMGSFGTGMSFAVNTSNAPEQPDAQGHIGSIRSSPSSKAQQHSSAGVATAAHAQQQRSSTQAFDQKLPAGSAFEAAASHPLHQQGARDARSMGDQAKQQQQPSAAGPADYVPPAAAPAPPAAWASFLSGFQQQAYVSPGARTGARRAGGQQRKGATPRASRMQQQQQRPAGAAGASLARGVAGFGSPAGNIFAFGLPMQQAGEAAAAAAAAAGAAGTAAAAAAAADAAAGGTPAPSTLPPGSAMSMDTSLPTAFTAAFSAMSVDAATPAAFGSNSSAGGSSQQWAFRGPRAAAVTGKRLFDTPASAGGAGDSSSTPSPFGSWGRPGARDGSAQQATAPGASRGGANPVPFPGFGGAQDGTAPPDVSSPAGGFAFNPGKPSPMTSGRKARHSRGSPAQKPPPAPSAFGGFGSPAFAARATASSSANASTATPGMASGGSFQGFFGGGKGPGSAASTPGFSPMMWSPAEAQAAAAAAAAAASPAARAAPGAGAGFGAMSGREQSAAASQVQAEAKLQQAAQQLTQQQASAAAAAAAAAAGTAAETLAAAAVDLPSDDSTESVAELLADLSASGNRPAPACPETAAMAGLREAVEQLTTAEAQPPQQQHDTQATGAASQQQQQQQDVPSFVFGSPADTGAVGGSSSSGTAWLSSPGGAGIPPTVLFEMSPLKSAGATSQRQPAAAVPPPSQQQPMAPAAPAAAPSAPQPVFSAGPVPAAAAAGFGVFGAGTSSSAAPSFGVGAAGGAAGGGGGAAAGGFSFTPGKAAGTGRGPSRAKKPTPTKHHKVPAAAAAVLGKDWGRVPFGSSAAAATGQQPSSAFGHQQQQQQQQDHNDDGPQAASVFGDFGGNLFAPQAGQQQQQPAAGRSPTFTPGRRKLHAQPRHANPAGVQQPQQQQQQQQQAGTAHAGPPSAAQQPWPSAAAAPAAAPGKLHFTLGKAQAGAGTPLKSPRKGRPAAAPAAAQQFQLQDALRQADVWTQRAQASFAAQNWSQADGEFRQGMAALQPYREQQEGAQKLSSLHMHRAAVRIGGGDPQGALRDSLEAIKLHKKNIEAYLRTATCLSKLGCLTAADRVLDKVLDMISARHDSWQALNRKRQQVHQLAHKQQRVVAAALGCDSSSAAATLAALSAGQPVQDLLQGFVSTCLARHSGAGAAAVAALSGAGTAPLEDSAAVQELVADAQSLITELGYWEDGTAMLAWLLLRSGQLGRAASVADAHPNAFFEQQPLHSNKQWGWRWWVLAQVRWQQGELTVAKQLLQEGQAQLQKLAQHANSSGADVSSSTCLWRLLLPSEQELPEVLQQLQQLLSLKEAGNAAIQAKQYDKAAEAYTQALALQPSCGFAAVIHSNRAAALQQQKRLVEALADCSRAVALDPKYARAYLRMAQVLESLHRADRAVVVLQDALKGAANAVDPATTRGHELTHGAALLQLGSADRRKFEDMLATAQVAARRFKTPHHYKTLGLAMGATEADIRKAYRALALKHHPDKALQQCRWAARLGVCGAAAAHLTAPSGGVEASLKAAANEVFGLLSAAHEELTNVTSRSKVDRDLRTEEQLYGNSSSSSYSRPAAYTYAYGGRRADSDYGFEDFFRRTAAGGGSSSGGTYQPQARPRPGPSAGGGGGWPGSGAAGRGQAGSRWYENNHWADNDEEDLESEEDEYDGYGHGGSGWHYSNPRSKY